MTKNIWLDDEGRKKVWYQIRQVLTDQQKAINVKFFNAEECRVLDNVRKGDCSEDTLLIALTVIGIEAQTAQEGLAELEKITASLRPPQVQSSRLPYPTKKYIHDIIRSLIDQQVESQFKKIPAAPVKGTEHGQRRHLRRQILESIAEKTGRTYGVIANQASYGNKMYAISEDAYKATLSALGKTEDEVEKIFAEAREAARKPPGKNISGWTKY